jgi:hypothetical protein
MSGATVILSGPMSTVLSSSVWIRTCYQIVDHVMAGENSAVSIDHEAGAAGLAVLTQDRHDRRVHGLIEECHGS